MSIRRFRGGDVGRNRAVAANGFVWAVAVAEDDTLDVTGQTRQCLASLDRSLAAAGSDRTRIVSAQVFMVDIRRKAEMDTAWSEWIGDDWRHWPQRACVGAELEGGTLVEIVVVALTGEARYA